MRNNLTAQQQKMLAIFEQHMNAELTGDLDTTMATMSSEPHLNHVPVMAGGFGKQEVRQFYKNHLVGKFFPPDVQIKKISSTVGSHQIVEEMVISFTHTTQMDFMLPEILPTEKFVEIAVIVIIGFQDNKISHEHIYWDNASLLVQIGLLDPKGLPICGAESAKKVLNPKLPSRSIKKI